LIDRPEAEDPPRGCRSLGRRPLSIGTNELAIQSATALNAYLTSVSSGGVDAGISSASSDEGTVAQGSPAAVARPAQAGSREALTEPSPEETDETPTTMQAALPALYGRNARSVAGGMRPSSISLIV
jgi:hypothetical protein